jgi:hypothetical protein
LSCGTFRTAFSAYSLLRPLCFYDDSRDRPVLLWADQRYVFYFYLALRTMDQVWDDTIATESDSSHCSVMDENTLLQRDPANLGPQDLVGLKSALRRLEIQKEQEIYQLRAKSQDVSRVLRASQGNSPSLPNSQLPRLQPKPLSPRSTWNLIRAEQKYPDEDTRVLVYDPVERKVTACDLGTVISMKDPIPEYASSTNRYQDKWSDGGNKWAIFTRLPSRIRDRIDIYIQEDSENAHTQEPWLVQVSTKGEHVQPGFMPYTTIYLKRLGFNNRMRVLLGNIQWLFILRFSNPRGRNPEEGTIEQADRAPIEPQRGLSEASGFPDKPH